MNPESPTPEAVEPQPRVPEPADASAIAGPGDAKAPLPDFLADAAQTAADGQSAAGEGEKKPAGAQLYDFRNPMLLSPTKMHRLTAHQEEFAQSMAARLSGHLRTEFTFKVTGIQTVAYQKLAQGWRGPLHLNLFKMEPLRGVAVLEISYHLGCCIVDRLMGGTGNVPPSEQEISEIEKVLLEQTVQLFIDEWSGQWAAIKALKAAPLGYENFGGFVQNIPLETIMLVIAFQAEFGECKGVVKVAVPYAAFEPLVSRLCQSSETLPGTLSGAPKPGESAVKWNRCFDDVCVRVTAGWEGLEMTAKEILALKVGDILPLASKAQQINVRVEDTLRFQGRPGSLAGQWAVQLTRIINPS